METLDAIRSRRNVRTYEPRPIRPEVLDQILDAGRRSPSGGNRQRWDFVVCTDRDQLNELSKVWDNAKHVAVSAATIALVAPIGEDEGTRVGIAYDLGQTTAHMMIAAAGLGIGSCHSLATDQELAQRILGYPDDRFCGWMIALGYPGDRPLKPMVQPDRRPLDEVVHRGRW